MRKDSTHPYTNAYNPADPYRYIFLHSFIAIHRITYIEKGTGIVKCVALKEIKNMSVPCHSKRLDTILQSQSPGVDFFIWRHDRILKANRLHFKYKMLLPALSWGGDFILFLKFSSREKEIKNDTDAK